MGSLVGRYVLLEELGRGGGGTVCVAFDTELERKVALKLLLPGTSVAAARREARALAKLDHPHVVRIFEFGQADDPNDPGAHQPFLAMELMPGGTFESFCATAAAPEILAALRDVASAIAAAHAADLIHGDIKPSNLLRSAEGQTKLSDFGVARPAQPDSAPERLAGTQRFLAPECLAGSPVSAASDQYAFCLTAWIALHRRAPWDSADESDATERNAAPSSGGGLPTAVGVGAPTGQTGGAVDAETLQWDAPGVPKEAVDALARGLRSDPAQRWETMSALADALSPARPSSRSRMVFGGLAVGSVALLGTTATMSNTPSPCADAAAPMATAWSADIREQIASQLDAPMFATLRGRADEVLDTYASAWTDMSRSSCEATHVQHTQSAELLDLRSDCLRRARSSFEVTTELLAEGGDDVRLGAHELIEALPPLTHCADASRLRATIAMPSDNAARESIFEARAELERVDALRVATRFKDADALLTELEPRVDALAYPPLGLEFSYAQAYLAHAKGENDNAVERASAAIERAWSIGDTDRARQLAVLLSFVYASELEQYDRAAVYGDVARGLAQRPGVEPSEHAAALAVNAVHLMMAGDYDNALQLQLAAIEAYGDRDDVEGASFHNDLAIIHHYAGDLEAATREHEKSLARRTRLLGERHPEVAQSLDNLAQVDVDAGRFDAAESLARQAREILLETLSPQHTRVLKNANTLGTALGGQDRWEEALPLFLQTHEGFTAQLGDAHPLTGLVRNSLGVTYEKLGQTDKALSLLAASVTAQLEARGPHHPALILMHANYGEALSRDGQHEAALAQLETAVDVGRRSVGLQHDHAVAAFVQLARAELRADHPARALELAEDGLARLALRDPPLPHEIEVLTSIKASAEETMKSAAPSGRARNGRRRTESSEL